VVRADLAARKIARASDHLDEAEVILGRPALELAADRHARDAAAFYLFLAIQKSIDLAAHWIADAGWPAPDDVGSTFDVLAQQAAIPADLADEMRALVRLRNRIAHGYASIDHDRIREESPAGIASLRSFLAAVGTAAGL